MAHRRFPQSNQQPPFQFSGGISRSFSSQPILSPFKAKLKMNRNIGLLALTTVASVGLYLYYAKRHAKPVKDASPPKQEDVQTLIHSLDTDTELESSFELAQKVVGKLVYVPQDQMLALYGLFKQATVGDVDIARPALYDFVALAKFEVWVEYKGLTTHQAYKGYIQIVVDLLSGVVDMEEPKQGVNTFSMPVVEDAVEMDGDVFSMIGAGSCSTEEVIEMLVQDPGLLLAQDEEGRTVLHWAVDRENLALVQYIVENTVDLDTQDVDGMTALGYGVAILSDQEGSDEVRQTVTLLMANGADVSVF